MRPDDRIDEWVRERSRADVPEGFADRVVAAVTTLADRVPGPVRVAGFVSGGLLAALRIAGILLLILPK